MNAIWLDKNLLRPSAFRLLNKWAMLVYLDFLRKRQMEMIKSKNRSAVWIIKNNGEIVYPYSEAEKKGIGRREFRNALDELIEKGFLDISHQGTGGRSGDMTKYFIDERWQHYGTPAFSPAKKPRPKDNREGRGWSVYHAKKKKKSVTKLTPKKVVSINEIDTPNKKIKTLSSDKVAISTEDNDNVTTSNTRIKIKPCHSSFGVTFLILFYIYHTTVIL